jgi:hypothetical protein
LSFLPLIFVLGRTTKRQQHDEQAGEIFARLREGLRYVRQDRLVLLLLCAAAAGSLFGYPYFALMPVLARKLFLDDAAGNGYLIGAVGAGALVAALTLSMVTPKRMLRMIILTTALFGLALGAVGFVDDRRAVMGFLVLCGVGMVTSLALCNTLIQQRTPDAMRGRVMSMYTFTWFAFTPFGNLMAGILAEQRGIGLTFVVLGAGLVITAIGVASFGLRMSRRVVESTSRQAEIVLDDSST